MTGPSANPNAPAVTGEVEATMQQIAILNNLLPKGFRLETYENARKLDSRHTKPDNRKPPVLIFGLMQGAPKAAVQIRTEPENPIEDDGMAKRHSTRGRRPAPDKSSESKEDIKYKEKSVDKKSSKGTTEAYTRCEQILMQLNEHPLAGRFLALSNIPGYSNATGDLMDLNKLGKKLQDNVYTTTKEFVDDARRIWQNILNLAEPGSEIYNASMNMKNYFEKLIEGLDNVPLIEYNQEVKNPNKNVSKGSGRIGSQNKKISERPMSTNEKALLKRNIMKLPQDRLQGIIEIIQSSIATPRSSETLEFDIDKLPVKVARRLEDYVKIQLPSQKKSSRKTGPPTKKRKVTPQ